MKKILLLAALLSATALTGAQAAESTVTTTTTHYHSESSYHWNPFAADTTGLYLAGQAGGSFPTGNGLDDDGAYAVSVGWQFHPMVRAELEAGYRNNDISGAAGDVDTWTYMLNAYWDMKNDTRFTPYIGAGAGWAYANLEAPGFDESDNAFVYQAIAGVSYAIDNNWALTAQYNWIDTADFDYAGTSDDYSAHEVKAGVRYTF